MEVVGREPVVLVVVGIVGRRLPVGDALAEGLVVEAAREIAVDLVGEGRGDVADLGLRLADLRAHEEGDDVAVRPAAQLHAVDAASHVLGHGEAEIVGPAAIVQVVVVEMDGGVVMRCGLPVALLAGPGGALHGAGRQVHQPAVQAVRAGILDLHAVHAPREVPGGDAGDAGRLDLAVEAAMRGTVGGGLGADQDRLRHVEAKGAARSCRPRPRRRRRRRASAAAGRRAACRSPGRRWPIRDTRRARAASCRPPRAPRRFPAPCPRASAPGRSLRRRRGRAARSPSAARPRARSARSALPPPSAAGNFRSLARSMTA